MLVYTFPEYRQIGQALIKKRGWRKAGYRFRRYQSGELYLKLSGAIAGQDCLIVGQTAPPDDNLLKLLMLADTLRKEGAGKITVLAPYLGYSRQEHDIKNFGQTTLLIGKLLKAAGVGQLITLDIHNPQTTKGFPVKLINLPATPLFARLIPKDKLALSLASPDRGSYERCAALADDLPVIFFDKQRLGSSLQLLKLHGRPTRRVILVDDILSTGETLVKAVRRLVKAGSQEIVIMVSHGQFKDAKWRQLLVPQVKRIYTTDSTPDARALRLRRLRLIALGPYLADYCHRHLK